MLIFVSYFARQQNIMYDVYQTEQTLIHCKKQLLVGLNQVSVHILFDPNSTPNSALVFRQISTAKILSTSISTVKATS